MEFMTKGFHIVLINCNKAMRACNIVKALCTDKEVTCVTCIETHSLLCSTAKGILLEHVIPMYLKDCVPDNVVVLDVTPHRTCFNPFYSSLYPCAFFGDPKDNFLKTEFIPYLQILASSPSTAQITIKLNYPTWSSRNLTQQ